MAGRVPAAAWYRRAPWIAVSWGEWRIEGVLVAASFAQRLIGIHAPGVSGLLLSAASVHGAGLNEPLQILHLSELGAVVGLDVLGVGGRVEARAHWVLEVPMGPAPPPIGARIRVLPSSQR